MKKVILVCISFMLVVGLVACNSPTTPVPQSEVLTTADVMLLEGEPQSTDSEPADASDVETVTVWCWDPNFNIPIMETAAEYYRKTHPNFEIVIHEMANEDVTQKLIAAFTAGSSEGLPDIVLVDDYDAQNFIVNYAGKFADLSGDIDFDEFAQYKVDALTGEDGGVYGLPFDSGVAGLFYRTDYLEEAGYSQEDMQGLTWSDFVQVAKDVKEKTGKWFVAIKPNRATHYIQIAMQSAGLWYYDENGDIYLKNNPAVREMLPILKELDEADVAYQADYYDAEAVGSITGGDTAAVLTAIWFSPSIRSAEDQAGLWAYTNIPVLETVEGATPYSNLGGASWFVLEEVPGKSTAIDFLKEVFVGNQDFYQEILENQGAVCTYMPAQEGIAYDYEDPFFNNARIYEDFTVWMDEIPGVDYGEYTTGAIDALRAVLQDYFDGNMDLDETLEAAEAYYNTQVA